MGYGIMAYRVDMTEIGKLYGSVKQGLAKKCASRIEQLDDFFDAQGGWDPTEKLMDQFTQGDKAFFDSEDSTSKHWYVIETFAEKLGKILPNGSWYPGGDVDALYEISGMKYYSIDKEENMELRGPDDFPFVFTLYRDSFDKAIPDAGAIKDPEQKAQFLQWIEQAQANNQDLLMYYY